MKKKRCCLIAMLVSLPLCGCPDYSHQRSVPDYENMTDPDQGESSGEERINQSEEQLETRDDEEAPSRND